METRNDIPSDGYDSEPKVTSEAGSSRVESIHSVSPDYQAQMEETIAELYLSEQGLEEKLNSSEEKNKKNMAELDALHFVNKKITEENGALKKENDVLKKKVHSLQALINSAANDVKLIENKMDQGIGLKTEGLCSHARLFFQSIFCCIDSPFKKTVPNAAVDNAPASSIKPHNP